MSFTRARFAAAAIGVLAAAAQAQLQANLTLNGGDVDMRQFSSASWSLSKNIDSYDAGSGTAIWRINAIKTGGSSAPLTIDGFVRIKNIGHAEATIGNIIVNLQALRQQPGGCWEWTTLTSNVADATNGDAATSAVLCAGASSERLGQFTENAGSGTLLFTDRDTNTIFSLVPRAELSRGESVPLRYSATFQPWAVGFQPGELARVELIVTFGNAAEYGGHGTICDDIDMSGNSALEADEGNVRSVPCRVVRLLPNLHRVCNDSVVVTDLGLSATGTAGYDLFVDQGLGAGVTISDSAEFFVVATGVNGGAEGGTLCNVTTLATPGENVDIIDDTHEDGCRRWHRFVACDPISLTASACIDVSAGGSGGIADGDYLTFVQTSYGPAGDGGSILADNFESVFAPGGMQIGLYDPSGGNAPPNGALWEANATGLAALQTYISAAGFGASHITADAFNATSLSGGTTARQAAALTLNIAFNDAMVQSCGGSPTVPFGDLYYCSADGDSLDGLTIRQVLDTINGALAYGAGSLPAGHTYATLSALATELNGSFADCVVSEWAVANLRTAPCE